MAETEQKAGKLGFYAGLTALILLLILTLVSWKTPTQDLVKPLAAGVPLAGPSAESTLGITKNERAVTLDPRIAEILLQEKGTINLELEPGRKLVIDFERTVYESPNIASVRGEIRGIPGSLVLLESYKGAVAGEITYPDGRRLQVQITDRDGKQHVVFQLDDDKMVVDHALHEHFKTEMHNAFPEGKVPEGNIISQPQLPWNQTVPVPGMPWFTTTLIGTNPWPQLTNVYGPPVVSLMVLYTPQAEDQLAGLLGIQTRIRLAMSQINACLEKSGTSAEIRLIHTEKIDYTASGSLNNDLLTMTYGVGPVMPEVHSLRLQHRADLVSLIVESSPNNVMHGASWMLTDFVPAPAFGFNVIEAPYINSSVWVHEIGHNLGCNHATNDVGGFINGAFNNSHGYRFSLTTNQNTYNFRTIMAYGPGRRLGYFSSPSNNFYGVPMGNNTVANNVYTIDKTAPMVGTYLGGGYGPPYYMTNTSTASTPPSNNTIANDGRTVIRLPSSRLSRQLIRLPMTTSN